MPLKDAWRTRPSPGPAGELGPDDEFGTKPLGVSRGSSRDRRGERRLGRRERRDGGQELRPIRVREAGADLAGVAQFAVLVHADEERAELDRPAGSGHPAADDQLLLGPDLDLPPGHRARAGHVRRVAVLGHDSLEAPHPGGLEERNPVGLDVLAQADARIRAEDAGEQPAALFEGLVEE